MIQIMIIIIVLCLYRRIGNDLDGEYKECALVIKEILNESNHTLKLYFKENILNGYINWYQIESYKQYEYVIKCKYPDCFCPNNEIRIINSNKLYIDMDLSSSEYSRVNILLISPYQELVKNKNKLKITTDGENAKDIWNNNPAKNGNGTDQNRRGNRGEDGSDGKAGKVQDTFM